MLGTKNQCWEVVGAWHGLVWFCCSTEQCQGLIKEPVLLYHPPLWGCPLPPPPHLLNTLENWVNGLGALREGELDTVHLLEPWQSRSCTHRALPEGCTEPEVELASDFKAVWSALVVLIHSSHCGSHPNP